MEVRGEGLLECDFLVFWLAVEGLGLERKPACPQDCWKLLLFIILSACPWMPSEQMCFCDLLLLFWLAVEGFGIERRFE